MNNGIKVLLGVLGGAVLVLVLLAVFIGAPMMGPGHMMGQWGRGGMMDGGWGMLGILWMLVPLLLWGGLLAVIVWAVMRIAANRQGNAGTRAGQDSAEDILRQRFARGEIDAEEYEQLHRILNEQYRKEVGPK
jgi:putative membrane protein